MYYFEGRVWVFGLLALGLVLVTVVDVILDRRLPNADYAIRFFGLLVLIPLAWSRSVRYHAVTVGVGLGLFLFHIARFTRQLVR